MVTVLAFHPGFPGSNPYISAMHLFICFFVMDVVLKMGACPGFAKEPLIPFTVQLMNNIRNKETNE